MFAVGCPVRCISLSLCHSFRFLEEQNKKAKSWENGKNTESNDVVMEQGKLNGNTKIISDSVSRKYKEDSGVSLNSFLKASPFLSADGEEGEEDDEMMVKSHSKSLQKDWHNEDESFKSKIRVTHSAREMFGECFSKWQNSQVANSDLEAIAEDIYLSRKQDKVVALAAALNKRELAGKFEELSPDLGGKARKLAKSPSIPSPSPPPRRNSDREMFMIRSEDSPFTSSRKQEAKVNVRMDFLGESLIR